MIYEEQILELFNDPLIKPYLDLRNYYTLKSLFDINFQRRSRIFSKQLVKNISKINDNTIIPSQNSLTFSKILKNIDNDLNDDMLLTNNFNNNYNNNEEEECKFMIDSLLNDIDISIFEDYEDYIIIKLIYSYIYSEEFPENSNILLSYHLFCSEIELLFCLRIASKLPNLNHLVNKKEKSLFLQNHKFIQDRINLLLASLEDIKCKKYLKNVSKVLIGDITPKEESVSYIEMSTLLIEDPSLPNKLISHNKLLVEGIFYFDIEEITKQLCLIDHKNLRKLIRKGFKELYKCPEDNICSKAIFLREKQFICYILFTILNQSTLENIKLIIQNYISLAYNCRKVRNYQSSFSIISCFFNAKLKSRKIIWNMLENSYQETYRSLENEYLEVYLKEYGVDTVNKGNYIPNLHSLCCLMHKFLSKSNDEDVLLLMNLSNDYKEFRLSLTEVIKNKLPYFKVNPLYIFLKYGFCELFHARKWNLKLKQDYSFLDDYTTEKKYSVLLTILMEKFDRSFE